MASERASYSSLRGGSTQAHLCARAVEMTLAAIRRMIPSDDLSSGSPCATADLVSASRPLKKKSTKACVTAYIRSGRVTEPPCNILYTYDRFVFTATLSSYARSIHANWCTINTGTWYVYTPGTFFFNAQTTTLWNLRMSRCPAGKQNRPLPHTPLRKACVLEKWMAAPLPRERTYKLLKTHKHSTRSPQDGDPAQGPCPKARFT